MVRKGGGSKRKAPAYLFDEKLQHVARALENLAVAGAPVATGSGERYPPLGLAFKGDTDGELHFPLGAHDTQKIKTQGLVAEQLRGVDVVWEVDGDTLEERNPRWREFLKESFDKMREPLGITSAAKIDLSLSKLLMVGAGAVIPVRRPGEERGAGVFGSMVVVLPGTFKGGSFEFPQQGKSQDEPAPAPAAVPAPAAAKGKGKAAGPVKERTPTWRPMTRKSPYDLTFAAFYDLSTIAAKPITSGTALCLVYDLVTTTPGEVPMFAGPQLVQSSVNAALTDYFGVTMAPLAKRLKVDDDALRTINEFASDRHFAYLVEGNTFEKLKGDELRVAQSLAAFCAQSEGQYVLYLSGVLCSRESEKYKPKKSIFASSSMDEDGGELKVTLKSPWLKHGDSKASTLPTVYLKHERDVAPLGRADKVRLRVDIYDMDEKDYDIVEKLHFNFRQTGTGSLYALVVQPASVEQSQLANMEIDEATARLASLLLVSRNEALRFARRVVQSRAPWVVYGHVAEELHKFVAVVLQINDLPLFLDVLQSVVLQSNDRLGTLRSGLNHFGYDACADTLVQCVLSTKAFHSRIEFINAVVDPSSGSSRIDPLLNALLSRYPYTNVKVDGSSEDKCQSGSESFGNLLAVAAASSHEKLVQMVSLPHPGALIQVVVPALVSHVNKNDRVALRPVVERVRGLFQKAMVVARNGAFAKATLPSHCTNCAGLQSFLTSTETQLVMPYTGMTQQVKHMETVLKHHIKSPASVTVIQNGGNTVRLTKNPGGNSFDLYRPAQHAEQSLNALLGIATERIEPTPQERFYGHW